MDFIQSVINKLIFQVAINLLLMIFFLLLIFLAEYIKVYLILIFLKN